MAESESSPPPTIEELIEENQSLRKQLEKAASEIERLRKELEEALRALKRQAAPFSRRKPKKDNELRHAREPAGSGPGRRGNLGAIAGAVLMRWPDDLRRDPIAIPRRHQSA